MVLILYAEVSSLIINCYWFFFYGRAVKQLKNSNAQQLEIETLKMEERIRALKEQMFKEKEERE